MLNRRKFIRGAGAAGVAAAAMTLAAPAVHAQQRFQWRMVTTWSPRFRILHGQCDRFVQKVEAMSEGRLKIQHFAGGELVPPFESFDAVSEGTVEMANSVALYWKGKTPAALWFASVPFGLNEQGMYSWLYAGGGLELWNEVYAPFNIVVFPAGSVGSQATGWFKKKINTMADLRGLRIRHTGLGADVLDKAGAAITHLPLAEIIPTLERGVIDAAELICPYDDMAVGAHRAARYLYYPSWAEPGVVEEMLINRRAWESLPSDIKAIVESACRDVDSWGLTQYNYRNAQAMQELKTTYRDKVELLRVPDEIIEGLRPISKDVLSDIANSDPMAKKVHEAYLKFEDLYTHWENLAHRAYYQQVRA